MIFLSKHINLGRITGGDSLCFWYLVVGGITLPLILSLALYPVMRLLFSFLIKKFDKTEIANENYNTK